ncbi:uncharacterized protein PV07_03929 [Cladophialophora immunda]|uniref:O-methyltransferase C-terminal domain-containing protein n=1 Tax=Cladophialophora immunda TaxID=569365 RepID=A0A0D2B463_9EURO|nr:uncharacterized protein PV07_03929 [Cladophialophora immunda]KIW32377.1 hypothetical protein PV07_03929 [Cladophialophora immunda]OQV07452.1 hypothetical protein CLAIMM_11883 isoform 1 [Cladophialophora immunda]
MSQVADFDALIEAFNSSAKKVRDYLASQDTNDKAGQAEGSETTEFPLALAPENVRDANKSMSEAMARIHQMFLDPVELNAQTTVNFQHLSCIRWIVHFNIPAHIPLSEPISYASVAQAAKVPEHQLRQIARMAMTNGVFREPSPNMLAHTPLSGKLATSPTFLETALFQAETTASTAVKMTEMTSKYGGSEKPNETAHNIAMETDLPFFAYLSKNPKIAARLQAAMKFVGGAEETHTAHLIQMFDWAGLGEAEVVDVGGSTGHVSIALARAFPNLTFTVQDLPVVVSKATSSPLPPEIRDRIVFTSHDFFEPQPAASSRASVFLVRMVVQNHPRTAAQTILRNIASAMKPDALILLNNHILPEPGTVGLRDEARDRSRSLFMMQAMNGGDRDEEEFRELVEGAGAGLAVQEVVKRKGSALGLIVIKKL